MGKHKLLMTDAEIDAAIASAALEPEGPKFVSVVYRSESGLDLFVFTLSDSRRFSVPRENLQALKDSTPETAADFAIGPFGDDVWWATLDQGLTLDGLLEGRFGNDAWMEHLQRLSPVAA